MEKPLLKKTHTHMNILLSTKPWQYSKLIFWFWQMSFSLCCLWNDHKRSVFLFFVFLAYPPFDDKLVRYLACILTTTGRRGNSNVIKYICSCLVRRHDLWEAAKRQKLLNLLFQFTIVMQGKKINHIPSETLGFKKCIASCVWHRPSCLSYGHGCYLLPLTPCCLLRATLDGERKKKKKKPQSEHLLAATNVFHYFIPTICRLPC